MQCSCLIDWRAHAIGSENWLNVSTLEAKFVHRIEQFGIFTAGNTPIERRIAVRLEDNPDVIVEIREYYHLSGDGASGGGELAVQRAEAVRQKIIAFDKQISARILVQPSIDATKLCRGDHGSRDPKIRQENQRAALSVNRFD